MARHLLRRVIKHYGAVIQQNRSRAELLNGADIMTNKKNGAALTCDRLHLTQALLLKGAISHRQDLVYDQYLWIQIGSYGKGQTHIHAAAITLHRRVQELLDLSKGHDLVELGFDFRLLHAQNGAVEKDVLSSGQFRMKPSADLKQTSYASVEFRPSRGGLGDPGKNL